MKPPVTLSAAIEEGRLRATVENRSDDPVRIWSRSCSWGWSTFSVVVARSTQPGERHELTAKPIRWTVNFPRVVDLEAGGHVSVDFGPGDPDWVDIRPIGAWKDETWEVRVRLRIPETPEARDQGVFIGEAISSPCRSTPPHAWLFA